MPTACKFGSRQTNFLCNNAVQLGATGWAGQATGWAAVLLLTCERLDDHRVRQLVDCATRVEVSSKVQPAKPDGLPWIGCVGVPPVL